MNHPRPRNAGFTLVEILIAFGLLMALGLGTAQMMANMAKANREATVRGSALMLRQDFQATASNDAGWAATLADPLNAALDCLRKSTDCAAAAQLPDTARTLVLHQQNGTVRYDGRTPTTGFTPGGSPCAQYPSPACPLHAQVTWTPLCPLAVAPAVTPPPCIAPDSQLSGTFIYNAGQAGSAMAWNPDNYRFTATKPAPGQPAPPGGNPGNDADAKTTLKNLCVTLGPYLNSPELRDQLQKSGYPPETLRQLLDTCRQP